MKLRIVLIIISIFFFESAYADLDLRSVPLFQPRRLQLGIQGQGFQSRTNLLENGVKEELPNEYDFTTYQMVLTSMYDASDRWSFSADLGLSYAESYDGQTYRNSRELRDIKLGLYRLYESDWLGRFIVDGYFLLNLVKNNVNEDEVSVGDGVSWLQAGAWWLVPTNLQHVKASAYRSPFKFYAGFRSRSGFSDLLILKARLQFRISKFIFGGEFNHQSSIIAEPESGKVNKEVLNQKYNASSLRYNSWNPEIQEGVFWFGYQSKTFSQFKIGASHVLGGQNIASGVTYFINWQTSMIITENGMLFSDYFSRSKRGNPRNNTNIEIIDYGPEPDKKPKIPTSDLEDL